jgi:hypothetical protein
MPEPADPFDDDLPDPEDDELDDDLDDDDTGDTPARKRRKKSPTNPTPVDRRIAAALLQLMDSQRYSYRTFADDVITGRPDEIWSKSRMQRQMTDQRFTIVDLLDFLHTLGEPVERFLARDDVKIIRLPNDLESWVRVDVACGLNEGDRDSIQAIIDRAKNRAGGAAAG